MKTQILILNILISCQLAFGQDNNKGLTGKFLVDSDFNFVELINDSLIYSSLYQISDTAKYEIIGNDLIIKKNEYEPNMPLGYKVRRFKYYISQQTDSTLTLISPSNFQLDYKDIKLFPNKIIDFEYIELEYLTPWSDNRLIRIDSQGNYYDKITYLPLKSRRFKRKHKVIKEQLNDSEILILKQKLADYYSIFLPSERGCPIDGETSNFVIKTNGQLIESKGCDLSLIHSKLLDYLLNFKTIKY
ncbi:MAG: hypothetical protein Q8J88_16610 [Bacteroidales bacterium]|nr:hypothetical protein [Bacteroidales bacterium]